MPTRAELSEQSLNQQQQDYLNRQKLRGAGDVVQIGTRIPQTGQYQVIGLDGGTAKTGVKIFSSEASPGTFVRPTRAEGQPTIALDYRNKPVTPAFVEEELPVTVEYVVPLIFTKRSSNTTYNSLLELWLGGDRTAVKLADYPCEWTLNDSYFVQSYDPGFFNTGYSAGSWTFTQDSGTIEGPEVGIVLVLIANLTFEVFEATSALITLTTTVNTDVNCTFDFLVEDETSALSLPLTGTGTSSDTLSLPVGRHNIRASYQIDLATYDLGLGDPISTADFEALVEVDFTPNLIYPFDLRSWITSTLTKTYISRVYRVRTQGGNSPLNSDGTLFDDPDTYWQLADYWIIPKNTSPAAGLTNYLLPNSNSSNPATPDPDDKKGHLLNFRDPDQTTSLQPAISYPNVCFSTYDLNPEYHPYDTKLIRVDLEAGNLKQAISSAKKTTKAKEYTPTAGMSCVLGAAVDRATVIQSLGVAGSIVVVNQADDLTAVVRIRGTATRPPK